MILAGVLLTLRHHSARPAEATVPYDHARFSVADARRAFGAVGVHLVARGNGPAGTTIGSADDRFEVDVFGSPERVNALGAPDLTVDANGRKVRVPATCTAGIAGAARWQGNVRVVVRCSHTGTDSRLLEIAGRALAQL